jgi:hypothetical protein
MGQVNLSGVMVLVQPGIAIPRAKTSGRFERCVSVRWLRNLRPASLRRRPTGKTQQIGNKRHQVSGNLVLAIENTQFSFCALA